MPEIGEKVVYGIHGVCTVVGVEEKMLDRKSVQYYVLEPVGQEHDRFYVPVNNPVAVSKLRPLMSRVQLDALFACNEPAQDLWIEEENRRKQYYRELLSGGDRAALISMIRVLYAHKKEQFAMGKKFHQCDENFLRDAQRLLASEFSEILEVSHAEAAAYIKNNMEE